MKNLGALGKIWGLVPPGPDIEPPLLVRLPGGVLSSQLGQLSLPSLRVGKSRTSLRGWG